MAVWSSIIFATSTNHSEFMMEMERSEDDRSIGCIDKINQMPVHCIALTFTEHMQKNALNNRNEFQQFFPFSDLSPVRCNVRYVVKESIHIKNNKGGKRKVKRIDFLPVFHSISVFSLLYFACSFFVYLRARIFFSFHANIEI